MKVNLLTIHYSLSCGAVMQTYATCKVLESLGHQVTLINFKNPIELKRRKSIKYWIYNGITKIRFDKFRSKYYPSLTKEYFNLAFSSLPYADVYVTGSDQIWNPMIVKDNLYVYMLNFLPDNVKRISYASSLGVSDWTPFREKFALVKDFLAKFDSLSVRESTGVQICKNEFNLNAIQVLDPTLLLKDYSCLVGNVKEKNEIVCFKLVADEGLLESVNYCKKKLNLKSRLLYGSILNLDFDRKTFFLSPQSWLKNIASAKFVFTDSFHGLAFALIFNKQFIVFGGSEKKISRIKSLLKIVKLEDRYVKDFNELKKKDYLLYEKIDYTVVNTILDKERKKSLEYLMTSLNDNLSNNNGKS